MKKVMLLLICISTMYHSFAQQNPATASHPAYTKQEYLQKSKKLWRGAIIMVAAGGIMVITGIVVGQSDSYKYSEHGNLPATLFITGCAIMLGSLAFSIPAHINKKRAFSLSFENQPSAQLQKNMAINRLVPSLNLKIPL